MNRPILRHFCPGLLVLVGALAAGCGSNSVAPPPPPPPPPVVVHDTPQSTMTSVQDTYSAQNATGFASLLAGDFHYTFSVAADPALVTQYGNNWNRDDEIASATHLFDGFTSTSTGTHVTGASNIAVALYSVQFADDPAHLDSTAYYQWATVARVLMVIEIPSTPDPQMYNIDSRHEFHLVRGDAAVLVAGQPATSDQWYVQRWDDLATNPFVTTGRIPAAGDPPTPTRSSTWGSVKAQYR